MCKSPSAVGAGGGRQEAEWELRVRAEVSVVLGARTFTGQGVCWILECPRIKSCGSSGPETAAAHSLHPEQQRGPSPAGGLLGKMGRGHARSPWFQQGGPPRQVKVRVRVGRGAGPAALSGRQRPRIGRGARALGQGLSGLSGPEAGEPRAGDHHGHARALCGGHPARHETQGLSGDLAADPAKAAKGSRGQRCGRRRRCCGPRAPACWDAAGGEPATHGPQGYPRLWVGASLGW